MKNDPTERRRTAVREYMKLRHLSVNGWTKSANISESALRKFLSGETRSMRLDNLEALAHAANTSVAEITGEDDSPPITGANRLLLEMLVRGLREHYSDEKNPLSFDQGSKILFMLHDFFEANPSFRDTVMSEDTIDLSSLSAIVHPMLEPTD